MDRGRVGTLAIGNKTIRDETIKHQQDVHLGRIAKIKNRKPGTSNTLDNTAPVIVKAALNNPRKVAKRLEFNEVTERENRVLLQRISAVLTAPPKITDEDYVRMRKIVVNLKGGKAKYEEEIAAKHHRIYLKHLKTMGPYYKPKEWELDYKRQLVQQKFMRQVTYERPKDYVSPLEREEEMKRNERGEGEEQRGLRHSASTVNLHGGGGTGGEANRSRSAAHINRVRDVKQGGEGDVRASASSQQLQQQPEHLKSSLKVKSQTSDIRPSTGEPGVRFSSTKARFGSDEDLYDDAEFEGQREEQQEELASSQRLIRVTEDASSIEGEGEMGESKQHIHDDWGEVRCSLVDGKVLVIRAATFGNKQDLISQPATSEAVLEAEAEIDVIGLAAIRGFQGDAVLKDMNQLRSLAKYIADSIEIKVEDDLARVILNLADADSNLPAEMGSKEKENKDQDSFYITGDDAFELGATNGSVASHASDEEIDRVLIGKKPFLYRSALCQCCDEIKHSKKSNIVNQYTHKQNKTHNHAT